VPERVGIAHSVFATDAAKRCPGR